MATSSSGTSSIVSDGGLLGIVPFQSGIPGGLSSRRRRPPPVSADELPFVPTGYDAQPSRRGAAADPRAGDRRGRSRRTCVEVNSASGERHAHLRIGCAEVDFNLVEERSENGVEALTGQPRSDECVAGASVSTALGASQREVVGTASRHGRGRGSLIHRGGDFRVSGIHTCTQFRRRRASSTATPRTMSASGVSLRTLPAAAAGQQDQQSELFDSSRGNR